MTALLALALFNSLSPVGFRPIVVKDMVERFRAGHQEMSTKSGIPILVSERRCPRWVPLQCGGPLPKLPADMRVPVAEMTIDGQAGTFMFHYGGTREFIAFSVRLGQIAQRIIFPAYERLR